MSDPVLIALIGILAALFGGGAVWQFLSARMTVGVSQKKDELGRLDGEVGKLRSELQECEERHGVLETRLRAVENKTTSYFAMWIKDRNGRLVWLNDKAFLTLFAPLGYARDELDGKTFRDLLDPVAASEIDLLDKAALAHPGNTQSILIQLHPDLPFLIVIKVASVSESGDVQYEGVAYNTSDPEIRNAMGTRRQVVQRSVSAESILDGERHE
jgi:hypothetical protein